MSLKWRKWVFLALLALVPILGGCEGCTDKEKLRKPGAPSNLVAKAVSYNRMDLTWQDNSNNEDGFNVYCAVGGSEYETIATLAANTAAYEHSQLQPMTEYSYYVQACIGEEYANSIEVSATTSCPAEILTSEIGRIHNHQFRISGKVQSHADEPSLVEITVSIYNPDTAELEGTATDTFYVEAHGTKDFAIDCVTIHVLFGGFDNYTVEVTDVEILY